MKDTYQVNNKGKKFGTVHVSKKMKEIILTGGIILLCGASVGVANHEIKEYEKEQNQKQIEEIMANYKPYVKTYTVEYKVKYGDTLLDLVSEYEDDTNQIYKDVDRIVDVNNLESSEQIQEGDVIKLCGVPEEHLADYGYTIDYTGNEVNYVKDMYTFVDNHKDSIVWNEDEEEAMKSFNKLYDYVSTYIENEETFENSEMLDSMINHLENMCRVIDKHTGISFDEHKTAYPIDMIEQNMGITSSTRNM